MAVYTGPRLVDSLCRDNKTNLHTGQLVPVQMSSLSGGEREREKERDRENFPPRIDGGPVEIIGGKRGKKIVERRVKRGPESGAEGDGSLSLRL